MTPRKRTVLFATLRMSLVYVLLCAATPALARWLTFPAPRRAEIMPAAATLTEAHARDGAVAHALRFDAPNAPLTVVFFHGSGELASDEGGLAQALVTHGFAALFAEYRGYGVSRDAGATTEAGVYADAEAVLASAGVPRDRIVLYGYSLGTGVAMEMAARGWGRAMVLVAPYTSIPDVAARELPIVPMHWLVRAELDSRAKAPRIRIPVFVAHGDADRVVPFDRGETIARELPHGRLVTVPGGGHTDLFRRDPRLMQKVLDFLTEMTPPR